MVLCERLSRVFVEGWVRYHPQIFINKLYCQQMCSVLSIDMLLLESNATFIIDFKFVIETMTLFVFFVCVVIPKDISHIHH